MWIEEREMFDQTEPPCYTPAMTNNNIPPEVTERLNKGSPTVPRAGTAKTSSRTTPAPGSPSCATPPATTPGTSS